MSFGVGGLRPNLLPLPESRDKLPIWHSWKAVGHSFANDIPIARLESVPSRQLQRLQQS